MHVSEPSIFACSVLIAPGNKGNEHMILKTSALPTSKSSQSEGSTYSLWYSDNTYYFVFRLFIQNFSDSCTTETMILKYYLLVNSLFKKLSEYMFVFELLINKTAFQILTSLWLCWLPHYICTNILINNRKLLFLLMVICVFFLCVYVCVCGLYSTWTETSWVANDLLDLSSSEQEDR